MGDQGFGDLAADAASRADHQSAFFLVDLLFLDHRPFPSRQASDNR
jgi:hypothetical protein